LIQIRYYRSFVPAHAIEEVGIIIIIELYNLHEYLINLLAQCGLAAYVRTDNGDQDDRAK